MLVRVQRHAQQLGGTATYVATIGSMKAQFADTMKAGEIFPYAPMGGVLALRNAWKADMEKKNPLLEEMGHQLSGLRSAKVSVVLSAYVAMTSPLSMRLCMWLVLPAISR